MKGKGSRRPMPKRSNKKSFRKGASVHPKNVKKSSPMRGGIRL